MATKWAVKELLTAIKMNNFGVRRMSDAEQVATLSTERLAGDPYYNTDNKAFQIYQSGTGATFNLTELSNFLFRNSTNLGITSPKTTVYNEPFINTKGKMNTAVFVSLEYLQEVSVAGEVEIVVTDGVTPVTVTDTLSSDPSPTKQYKTYIVDTTSFAVDDVLNVQVKLTQVQVEYVEMRGI